MLGPSSLWPRVVQESAVHQLVVGHVCRGLRGRHKGHAIAHDATDDPSEQRVVSASKDERVNARCLERGQVLGSHRLDLVAGRHPGLDKVNKRRARLLGNPQPRDRGEGPGPRVTLEAINGQRATVRVDGVSHEVDFAIPGVHNLLNACAALGVVLEVLGEDADLPGLLATLGTVQAAFGRGEVLTLDGRPVQLSLVKNPAGFRMGLLSAAAQAQAGEVVVVAINDEYADGRDMSWLWDVDFAALRTNGVAVVTGVRAWDMALRLRYDDVEVTDVEPDLRKAVALMRRAATDADRPMRIFTTYTAMLALRSILGEMTDVEEVMS